jgi:hypothetical protein
VQVREIEPTAEVAHGDFQFIAGHLQLHLCLSRAAVLLHISKSLLNDSKDAKRGVVVDGSRDIVRGKVNGDTLLRSELLAQGGECRHESEALDRGRMQAV